MPVIIGFPKTDILDIFALTQQAVEITRGEGALLVQQKLQFRLYKEGEDKRMRRQQPRTSHQRRRVQPPLDRLSALSLSRGEVGVKPCTHRQHYPYRPMLALNDKETEE